MVAERTAKANLVRRRRARRFFSWRRCDGYPHPEEPAKRASRRTRMIYSATSGVRRGGDATLVLRDAPSGRSSGWGPHLPDYLGGTSGFYWQLHWVRV